MKKLYLRSLIAFAACKNHPSKATQRIILALLLCLISYTGFATVTVTPASGGTSICSNQAVGGTSPAFTTVGTITVTEGSVSDLSVGSNQLILTAPTGWQFNSAVTPTFGFTAGRNITSVTGSITSSTITIFINASATTLSDAFTITGVQVQATSTSASPGIIFATTAAGVAGVVTGSSGTNFGSLSLSAAVTPSVSLSASSTTICSGTNVTFTPTPTNGGASPFFQWQVNGANVATGATFAISTLTNGNTVDVVMTSSAACVSPATVTSNTVTMTVNPLPTTVTASGAGTFCGSTVITAANGGSGTIYFQGTTSGGTSTATPSTSQTVTTSGTYYFRAQSASGCWGNEGSVAVTINTIPTLYSVTGGGGYCSGGTGVSIGLSSSDAGVSYQLFRGATGLTSMIGTGAALDFGLQTTAGTYTIVANNAGCTRTMTGSATVTINAAPTAFTVTGGGSYCSGAAGVNVGLNNSTSGVSYQLFLSGFGAVGSPVSGTGSSISFGAQTAGGTYTVVATNSATGCTNNMAGSATITVNPLPTVFSVTGGGAFCTGGSGFAVGLTGSQSGVNYFLFRGASFVAFASGTGSVISFGTMTTAGTYTVTAVNATTGCQVAMTGSAVITINPLPAVFAVTGGGGYCSGGTGSVIGLAGSEVGVNYQLFRLGIAMGSPVAGTGSAITFAPQTTAGNYTVVATNATTGCTSNMTGSATVSINPLPGAFALTGGGTTCAGGSGVPVGLSGSVSGINYQLFVDGVPTGASVAGTGAAISFGNQVTGGTYTAVATNAVTGCTSNMTGTATVTVNPAPTAYVVTGGGGYCSGGTGVSVGLSSSDLGVNYQLFQGGVPVGGTVAGTGSALDFGLQTTAAIYTVVATNPTTTCTNNMTGSATVTVNPLPTVYIVMGGGNYCSGGSGVPVDLSGSDAGISYQLLLDGSPIGGFVTGTGFGFTFGNQTAAGTYTVFAIDGSTTCTNTMFGSADVTINPLPTAFTVTGGGSYCSGGSGVTVGLTTSVVGVDYQLFLGATPMGAPVAGTGAAISFGLQTTAGIYTVVATDATTTCTNNMTGSATITVNPLPTAFAVTGGGNFCSGGLGVTVGLSGSDIGVSYQLFVGGTPVGSAVAGTGSALSFGMQTIGGSYTVVATDGTTTCTNNMTGSATVTVDPLPTVFTVTGGGGYCTGSGGVDVALSGSEIGVNYQMFNGFTASGSPMAGTGAALDFGFQTAAGVYSIVATNVSSTCTSNMTPSVAVTIYPLPVAYTMTGGGSYCSGGIGVDVGLSSSDAGVDYQLYNGFATVGTPVSGTGAALDFGLQTAAGIYNVIATDALTTCSYPMSGSATVVIDPLPTVYPVSGGGTTCAFGTTLPVDLGGSAVGINYHVYNGSTPVGSPVAGTGSAMTLGSFNVAGTYSVSATNTVTGCTNGMSGTAVINVNPLPVAFNVTGGGHYCAGGTGMSIGLDGSEVGVNYQLYNGATTVGAPMPGTGSALDFGLQTTAGTYTIIATNGSTTCINNMTGSVDITIDPLPGIFAVSGGGTYCAGGAGLSVGLLGSEVGIDYQLYLGATAVGTAMAGTGAALDFGLQTGAGVYTVVATNSGSGCQSNMTGSATINVNAAPGVFTVTGGGSYCVGGSGYSIGLSSSEAGINYQLYNGATAVGGIIPGTGSALDFGIYTAAGTYTIVATNPGTGCTSNMTGSAIIVVNPLPAVFTVSGGGSYCAGGVGAVVTLSSSEVGVNYQFYNGSTATGSPVAGTGSMLNVFETLAGTYTVTATSAASCSSNMTGSATVTIDPLPAAITGTTNLCAGATSVVSDATASGTWSSSDVTIATVDASGNVTAITAGTYNISYTLSTGCFMLKSGTVYALPVIAAIAGPSSVCQGSSISLSDATPGGVWTSSDATLATVDAAGTVIGVAAGTVAITYTVTNATGCDTFETHVVTVNPAPSVMPISGVSNICGGLTTTMSDATPGGIWSSSDPSVASISSTGVVTGVSAGTAVISYSVTNSSGCTVVVTHNITIGSPMPSATVLPVGSASICHGNPANLGVITSGVGLSYQWSIVGVGDIAGATNATYMANVPGLYQPRISNGSCSVSLATVNVVPGPNPVIAFDSSGMFLYTGSFATYQWYFNGSPVAGANTHNFNSTAPGVYRVVVADGNGCVDTSAEYIIPGDTRVTTVISGADIKVYPNPATSVLHIDAPQRVYVSIMSPDGKLFIERKEAVTINVGQLADGMYLIMIYDENNMLLKTDRFVKVQ